MHFRKQIIFILILACGIFSSNVFAGGKSGQFGFGLTVAEPSPVFIFHYWSSDNFTISPEFSINSISEPSIKRFNFGITLAKHGRANESFRPFFGLGLNYDVVSSDGDSFADLYVGPLFGGEYFFCDNFSVSGAYQLVVIMTDDQLSPGMLRPGTTYISSAQLLTVQYYF